MPLSPEQETPHQSCCQLMLRQRTLMGAPAAYQGVLACACSDPANPILAGRLFVGGSIRKGGPVKVGGAAILLLLPACSSCWI